MKSVAQSTEVAEEPINNIIDEPVATKKDEIVGLNGQLALSMMSRRQKKKLVDQMTKDEEDEKALKERILKAK